MTHTGPSDWGDVTVEEAQTVTRRLGPLTVLIRRSEGEIWVAHQRQPTKTESTTDESNGPAWTRWAHREPGSSARLMPAFPDRLVVVSPEVPFHLAPGADARIYVRIPLWARILSTDAETNVLTEAPTVQLSDTWWGDFATGELGYWLPTRARRRVSDDLFVEHLAVCPLSLRNRSDQGLPVEKFALRVSHLSLYRDGAKLWGAETRVAYEDDEDGSRIDITESPPPEASGGSLICPPREPIPRGFRALTFLRLN